MKGEAVVVFWFGSCSRGRDLKGQGKGEERAECGPHLAVFELGFEREICSKIKINNVINGCHLIRTFQTTGRIQVFNGPT